MSCQSQVLYLGKIYFRKEEEITLSDDRKQREFVTSRSALKEYQQITYCDVKNNYTPQPSGICSRYTWLAQYLKKNQYALYIN